MLSGFSRIFSKPFANVHISRKVPFAHVWEVYAYGPRSCKTFHGFLHGAHILSQLYTCGYWILTIPRGEFNQFLAQQLHITEIWQLRHRCQNSQSLEISKLIPEFKAHFSTFWIWINAKIEISQKISKDIVSPVLFFGASFGHTNKKRPQMINQLVIQFWNRAWNIGQHPPKAASACRRRPCLMVMARINT